MPLLVVVFLASGYGQALWPTFQYNNQRTGLSPFLGPLQPETSWTYTTGGDIWSSPAIGQHGTIYFGSEDGYLYALHADGSLKWRFTTSSGILSAPALDNRGRIYIGSKDSCVYCIEDSVTYPRLNWTFHANGMISAPILVGNDGTVYARTSLLYAIDPAGNQKWTYHTHLGSQGGPALSLDGNTVYIETCDPPPFEYAVAALNTNGSRKWLRNIGSAPFDFSLTSPTVGSDRTIYFPTFTAKTFFAINPDGTVKWSCNLPGEVMRCSAALGPGDTIYIGSTDHNLYAINPSGIIKWTYPTQAGISASPIIGSCGTIYFASGDKLYALNPDGTMKWEYAVEHTITSSPALANDKLLFGAGNKLYALKNVVAISDRIAYKPALSLKVSPNPFSAGTRICFTINTPGPVNLSIYDVFGRLIRVLTAENKESGQFQAYWNGTDNNGKHLGSGVYLCKLKTNSKETAKPITLLSIRHSHPIR